VTTSKPTYSCSSTAALESLGDFFPRFGGAGNKWIKHRNAASVFLSVAQYMYNVSESQLTTHYCTIDCGPEKKPDRL